MIYSYLIDILKKGAGFFALLDPGVKLSEEDVKTICTGGADAILVGGSVIKGNNFSQFVKMVKSYSKVPVIIFPGDAMQVSQYADAILFLSLLSGRNPDYLIGEHTKAAPVIKKIGLEVIPAAYLLIDSRGTTSVLSKTQTIPIPRDKIDIAKSHALAGEYLGMKFIYLEAGSGAKESVPDEMITAVKNYINIPLIVGGGIRTPDSAKAKVKAGADFIVIGNTLQKNPQSIKDFVLAIHSNF